MGDLLPGQRNDDPPEEPRVVGIDGDDADKVLSALSAGTAREILSVLHEESATASEIATRVDTTLQNTQYHLDSLTDAGLVVETETVYSEKGREMSVYGPADRALVVVAGGDETSGLRGALRRLLGALLPLTAVAATAEWLLGGPFVSPTPTDTEAVKADPVETATPAATDAVEAAEAPATATPAATDAVEAAGASKTAVPPTSGAADAAPTLLDSLSSSPGVLLFVGGCVALATVALLQQRH